MQQNIKVVSVHHIKIRWQKKTYFGPNLGGQCGLSQFNQRILELDEY